MSALEPRVVALLGFGEAGTTIARGLGGWLRNRAPGANTPRELMAIDIAVGRDARGDALAATAAQLGLPIGATYGAQLAAADVVFSVVPGENAEDAARSAAPYLRPGALYLDLCTVTSAMAEADRAIIEAAGGRYVDVAVMGSYQSTGHKAPLLLAGPDAEAAQVWLAAQGFVATVLGPLPGSASGVKMLRSVLIKGLEALAVESFVAAREQGLLDEVLDCLGDVDARPFRDYLTNLVQTHIVHAHRRWEEMGLVAQTLRETGIEPLMTTAIERSHRRTVEAGIAPPDGKLPDFQTALALLTERVVRPGSTKAASQS
jgi:3-hydroxyisobutyrate dehydrogenase-like beta-hydroxyacid dehydrogenase